MIIFVVIYGCSIICFLSVYWFEYVFLTRYRTTSIEICSSSSITDSINWGGDPFLR